MPTIEEKYEFLCKFLEVDCVSLWEQDGHIRMLLNGNIYFQFDKEPTTVDEAIVCAMKTWKPKED